MIKIKYPTMKWERCLLLCVFVESQDALWLSTLLKLVTSQHCWAIQRSSSADGCGRRGLNGRVWAQCNKAWMEVTPAAIWQQHPQAALPGLYPSIATSHSSKIIPQMWKTSRSHDGSQKRPSVLDLNRLKSIKRKYFFIKQRFII